MTSLSRGLLAGALAALLALLGALPASAETARSAKAFTDSAGINTHLGYSDTVYWQNWPMIRDRLLELGVSHIRDGTYPAEYPDVIGPTTAGRYQELGLGLNLLVGHEQAMEGRTTLQDRLNWIKANNLAPQTIGIEGSNEFYIGVDHKDDWENDPALIKALRDMQCDIASRVKNDAAFDAAKVIAPSGGVPFWEDYWHFHVAYGYGDMAACMDRGNLHAYPGEDPPDLHESRDLGVARQWAGHVDAGEPQWITENGYWTKSPNDSHVSEQAQGVYVPRMALEHFRRGNERLQLYELIDLNSGSNEIIDNYGLLRTDGTRKPAFNKLRNLLSLTKDTEDSIGSLDFTIACTASCHSPVRHVLMRHSDGSYLLAYWSESRVWDGNQDTPQPDQAVDVTLAEAPGQVELYSVANGTTPLSTDASGSKVVKTHATDDVRLLRITPAAS